MNIAAAIALLVERDDNVEHDDRQQPGYRVSNDTMRAIILIDADRPDLIPELPRPRGNPNFKSSPVLDAVLDDIEADARWLKDRCKLLLDDRRMAAALYALRDGGGDIEVEAADLVERVAARCKLLEKKRSIRRNRRVSTS